MLSKLYLKFFALFVGLYGLSFLASFYPSLGLVVFIILVLACLFLSLMNLKFGLVMLASELIINSKGYLFSWPLGGTSISLRIALWAVVLSVWLLYILNKKKRQEFLAEAKQKKYQPLWLLAILVFVGFMVGCYGGNEFSNIFFDFNAWLYWLLVLPVLIMAKPDKKDGIIMLSALSALAFISLFLLYSFTHNLFGANRLVYTWVRDIGLAEVTLMAGGFYRVFIQSQLYLLLGFFAVCLMYLKNKLAMRPAVVFAGLFLAPIIAGLSRSFWIGLACGAICLIALQIKDKVDYKKIAKNCLMPLGALVFALVLLFAIVKFPFPQAKGDINAGLLTDRASAVQGEAGASSRWALLPELFNAIKKAPILGSGFGATVTYKSEDPRIKQASVSGLYTTYAFEWGWLDIWLKIGFLGLLALIWLCYDQIRLLLASKNVLGSIMAISIVIVAFVSFFSPYYNHPLGIGLLLFNYYLLRFKD